MKTNPRGFMAHVCTHKAHFPSVHHAWYSCSVFTALWCGCSVVKLTFCHHQTPSWLWLVWTHLTTYRSVGTNNPQTPLYYGHTSSPRIAGLYHIIQKLLEKQRVQNRFASYEVHIGHFFYNVNVTVSFGNCLTLGLFSFPPDWQTNWQTDKTNCLITPSRGE